MDLPARPRLSIVYNALREPLRRALETLVMERHGEAKATFPPFAQQIFDRGKLEGRRDSLLGLLERASIPVTESDRARIQACTDPATLDRWIRNIVGAKTAADVFS